MEKEQSEQGTKPEQTKPKSKMELKTQVFASLTAGLLPLSVGSSISLTSSMIPLLLKEGDLVDSFQTASWLATIYLIFAIPTTICGGILSDKFGRRRMAICSCFPLLAGWIILSTAPSFGFLLLGRALCSVGVWLGYPCANVLVSEVVHPSVRGLLGGFPSILLSAGMFISYLLGYLLDSWRVMCWILVAQPILTFTFMSIIKESPYWLIQNNKKLEGLESLQWYRGKDYDVTEEYNEIVNKKEESKKVEGFREKVGVVFSSPFLRALSCSGVIFFLTQFSGISTLTLFMVTMFQSAESSFDPRLAPVIVGITRTIFAMFSSAALRTGNRKYMYCGCTFILCLCTLCLALLTIYRRYSDDDHWILGYLPFPLILLMFMAHSFGVNSVLHLITAEVFPTSVRSLGAGVALCLATAGNALQSALYPHVLSLVGTEGCFLWFSVSSFFTCIYAFIIIPDNRGLSLVRIERDMMGEKKEKISNP